jgi:hypothetical protein
VPAVAAPHPGEPEGGHSTLNPQSAGADVLGDEVKTLLILGGVVYTRCADPRFRLLRKRDRAPKARSWLDPEAAGLRRDTAGTVAA